MSSNSLVEDDITTAPHLSWDAGGDFLNHVPFESLYQMLLEHACSIIELAAGHHGKAAVAAVLRSLPRYNGLEGSDLEIFEQRIAHADLSLLDDTVDGFDWQEIAAEFFWLFNFARHGETTRRGDSKGPRAEIEHLLQHFRRLTANPAVRAIAVSGFEWFKDTLAAAEARWAIDNGRPVAPDTLAALAGVKIKTLANLIAAGHFSTDDNGHISAVEALQYLGKRKNFIRSTWQIENSTQETILLEASSLQEQVFVPVDADGGPFLPFLARRGRDGQPRFIIGDKSSPVYVEDYWEALARLAKMPVPRWRRPASGTGGWSLVSAQDGWRRFAKADIQRMLEAARIDTGRPSGSATADLA